MSAISPVLGRSERRAAAARYVEGLLLEGKRKSIEPLAQRLGVDAQSLQQFVADSPWDEALVWSRIRREVIAHFEPIESWIVDETAWVKQGRHSVGVAQQYCGAIGKNANCQLNVSTDGQQRCGRRTGGRAPVPARKLGQRLGQTLQGWRY